MHDTAWFELAGKPSVFVASSAFESAAEIQARALGLDAVQRIFVPHPIQDANDADMRAKADSVLEEVLAALEGPSPRENRL